jgi:hypothetical protein
LTKAWPLDPNSAAGKRIAAELTDILADARESIEAHEAREARLNQTG